ncbi:MAG: hypothetical protein WA981_14550 [Glaciecola sp.]
MSIRALNGKQYLCVPIVGAVFGLFWAIRNILIAGGEDIGKDKNTAYKVTYEDHLGNREVRTEQGSGLSSLVFYSTGILIAIWAGAKFFDVLLEVATVPLLFLLPVFCIGLFSFFYKKRLDKFYTQRLCESIMCHPLFIISIILSFYSAYHASGLLKTAEESVFLYVPFAVFIFLGFLGPLYVSVTLALRFYLSTIKSKGLMGILFTRMNLVILCSSVLSIYAFAELNNLANYEALKSAVLEHFSFTIKLSNFSAYTIFLIYTFFYLAIPVLITMKIVRIVAYNNEEYPPAWLMSTKTLAAYTIVPILICVVVWTFPDFTLTYFTPNFVESAVKKATFQLGNERNSIYRELVSKSLVVDLAVIFSIAYLYFRYYISRVHYEYICDVEETCIKRWAFIIYIIFGALATGIVWSI